MNRPWVFRGRGILFSPFLAMMLAAIAAAGPLSLYCIEKRIIPAATVALLNLPPLGMALWSIKLLRLHQGYVCEVEEALREARDSLKTKVAEHARDLEQANERLKALNHSRHEFLAAMGHELRTPLNSIIGFSGILRQELAGPMNEEQKKQLGMVNDSAKHLLGLINDILDRTRGEAGGMETPTPASSSPPGPDPPAR